MSSFSSAFSVIDSHTAGHPTRVILSGIPNLSGSSVRDKRDHFRQQFDHLRPALLHEPRGHSAMVGLVPVASDLADYGAFFISSYVYLDMCGHGTIGFARTLAFTGQISAETGDSFTLETPAGVVTVGLVWNEDGSLDRVRIANVPSYVGLEHLTVSVEGLGNVDAAIVYAGMWYALVDAAPLRLELVPDNASALMRAGAKIKDAIKASTMDLPLLAGAAAPSVLFYDADSEHSATHFLVLESNKFDRSPCGTGTSARLTYLLQKGLIAPDQIYEAKNIFGIPFKARLQRRLEDGRGAMIIEIEGSAFITSTQTIYFETSDPLSKGFLAR
ncbi:proline racemase family protein [Mesorhizobium sp. ES1-1]|uniref:proline racemase family protein n=1 Tax=Mesorhizobium sp. ES1-1 TaxID=2876629 RepID=UPI001CCCC5A0|nr:proline racemase family protein [Mesorhizobium sp. ES1-1]MBZ9678534.1 proline racemase family protein [Mesorhizobium sp. ES1-1]